MRLEMGRFDVSEIDFGTGTELNHGRLLINREELESMLAQDPSFASIGVELARPGERVRIVHVLDQIEPRVKIDGGPTFPGFLGPPVTVGSGRTHRLSNVAILQAGEFPVEVKGLLSVHQSTVDMCGPGPAYSPFASTLNVVLFTGPTAGFATERY